MDVDFGWLHPISGNTCVFYCSYNELCKAWIATRRVSKDDWMEWVRRLSVELLKESPSPALRSCWALANIYNPLARFVTKDFSQF